MKRYIIQLKATKKLFRFFSLIVDAARHEDKEDITVSDEDKFTLNPLYVQLPNFILQSWSSKGNHVISILQVDLNIPGGIYVQLPLLVTTTFVGYVPSNASSALNRTRTKRRRRE